MRKVAYIIPGFTDKISNYPYHEIGKWFEEKSITPVYIDINWDLTTEVAAMPSYVEEFLKIFKSHNKEDDEVYLFGYSFGAMIAFISSAQVNPNTLIIGSMSPFFKEYNDQNRELWNKKMQQIGITYGKEYSFDEIANKLKSRVFILIGSKELGDLFPWANHIHHKLKGSQLFIAENSPHQIGDMEYLKKLKEIILSL